MLNTDKKPIIGITTYGRSEAGNFYLPDEYVDAVRIAGGIPVLLPPGESHSDQVLHIIDGLIFTGGGDIDPALYSGREHPSIERIDHERDAFELELAKKVFSLNLPVLGVCRGFQMLVIATGGNLITHIPEAPDSNIFHRDENKNTIEHSVQITQNSRLAKIIGSNEAPVKSKHHQAVKTIGDEWQIVAHSSDGIIESIEHKKHPWMIAVLWHPELAPEDKRQQRLFKALVDAAGR